MADLQNKEQQALKEKIGKHLRAADELTRQKRYEEALLEIEAALNLDPKNNYARSFMERVKLMYKRSQPADNQQINIEEVAADKDILISKHLATAEELVANKEYKQALNVIAEVYKLDANNFYARSFSDRIEALMMEQDKAKEEQRKIEQQNIIIPNNTEQTEKERGSLLMYRELLKEVLWDGKITTEEETELQTMRDLFNISADEHAKLVTEVKIESYIEALKIAWRDHTLSVIEKQNLEAMIEKYGITPEEQSIAEKRYDEIKRASKIRGSVLVVEPDRETLVAISKVVKQNGFSVFMAQKAEDALQILNTQKPNIIISELVFVNSMDGISFLNKIKEKPENKNIPFIFISKNNDIKIMHACYKLGADNFLFKPLDYDLLFAIIDGKLSVFAK